ncbi:MAG: hydrogenase nickel incorporation protein HypB [Planctomycetes bacterium]|nr:hydrogenase nickel incorporation protein HypB [Planctomycetota bacterium]
MTRIKLNRTAQSRNQPVAEQNRTKFQDAGVFVMNLIGSPGCGKTTILEYTARHCPGQSAVIVGDVKTALDADRILQCDIPAYPIETGGSCHLSAQMIADTIARLDLDQLDYLFIENVGNLVCPSTMDLGENIKVGVLSVPEGDEKVRKYPALFLRTEVVFINKADLLPYCPYDVERVKEDCRKARPDVKVFEVSAAQGTGFGPWMEFLRQPDV